MPRTATSTPTSPRAPSREAPGLGGRRWAAGLLAVGLLTGGAVRAVAQVSLDTPPLDEHDAKRLDRDEKALKELRAIVFQGRETGAPVQVEPADTEANLGHLSDHLNDVDQTLAKRTGELEVTRHDLDQARHDIADLRAANAALKEQVDTLAKTVQSIAPPPPPAQPPPEDLKPQPQTPPPAPSDPARQFAAAQAALEQGDMAAAEAGFRRFIALDGDGPRGPEARYGLARTLIARQAWPDAATADIGAIRGWPHTRWAPAAILDLSRALIAMGKAQDACETLSELGRRYHDAAPEILKDARRLRLSAACA